MEKRGRAECDDGRANVGIRDDLNAKDVCYRAPKDARAMRKIENVYLAAR